MLKPISSQTLHFLPIIIIFSLLPLTPFSHQQDPPSNSVSLLPSDAVSLLVFKSKADLNNHLLYTLNERFDYCEWQGVKCAQGRVVRFVLQGAGLRGSFPPDSLSRLDQLRVLSLQNNSLSGPVPDLSGLANLKSLFLGHNSFSGSFPVSLLSLHRLRVLDLPFNNFTGSLPVLLPSLDRLDTLRLEFNQFNGSLPALNQTLLNTFNVSGNNLTGPVPVTPTLSRFGSSCFSNNPGLCGEIINKACSSRAPFFGSSNATTTTTTGPAPLSQSAQSQSGGSGSSSSSVILAPPAQKRHKKTGLVLGFTIGVLLIIATVLILITLVKTHFIKSKTDLKDQTSTPPPPPPQEATHQDQNSNPPHEFSDSKPVQESSFNTSNEVTRQKRSGFLVFCAGESNSYTLEQLMRASAELLGRGSIGTTYKAVLDNQLIVTVKRLDGIKTSVTSEQVFEKHMDAVGGLRHPNLVPVRAYFQAKGERLVIYDYQPNGSLYNLIHGSRTARAKPLHWTSCLKIAEDVAQGLGYLHQVSRLIHGNLKSTNVLLGMDFEACLTDYCLAVLAEDSANEDPDTVAYKAPEARKSIRRATPKSDIYSFGVLLLELLTGKYPSQHPFLVPIEMLDWVRTMREDDGTEDKRLGMLVEVATVCRLTSPEQRPPMWQVLKMIQEIKESATMEDNVSVRFA